MKNTLYILKQNDTSFALDTIQQQANDNAVEVILIQDAVHTVFNVAGIAVFALADSPSPYTTISYQEMLEKIFRADTVITW